MADSINLMLDEITDDLRWLIEFAGRHANFDEDIKDIIKLKEKYFGENP